jgi:hypothetical protein
VCVHACCLHQIIDRAREKHADLIKAIDALEKDVGTVIERAGSALDADELPPSQSAVQPDADDAYALMVVAEADDGGDDDDE